MQLGTILQFCIISDQRQIQFFGIPGRNKEVKNIILFMILLGFAAVPARASLMYNTGEGIDPTTKDTHYSVSYYNTNSYDTQNFVETKDAFAISKHSLWTSPVGDSEWIGPTSSSVTDDDGLYVYSTTFELSSNIGIILSGSWATDNSGQIWLNGSDTGITKGDRGFESLDNFTITGGFIEGENTLEFRVINGIQETGNPTGLLVTNLSLVPVPATVPLGFIGLGVGGWKLRKSL